MDVYGKQFIGAVATDPDGFSELHWSVRPFWRDLYVELHPDGISVVAGDEVAEDGVAAQSAQITAPCRPQRANRLVTQRRLTRPQVSRVSANR